MIEIIHKAAQGFHLIFSGNNYLNARASLRCELLKLSDRIDIK